MKNRLALGAIPILLGLGGCEAQLNLEGVSSELDKPVRRTDLIQDIAANDHTLVAIGGHGVALIAPRSTQPVWQRIQLDTHALLVDITSCPDGSFAALASDRQLWSADAQGQNWTAHSIPTQESLLSLTCTPNGNLWVGGSFSTLLKSVDGGSDWESVSLNEDAMFTGIQFFDAQNGIAVGEFGLVVNTTDGGLSWNPVSYIPNEFYPQSAWFRNAQQGWVTGLTGSILRTDDGGLNWQTETSGVEVPLYNIGLAATAAGASIQYILGDNSTLLVRSDAATASDINSGQPWAAHVVSPSPGYLRGAVAVDDHLIAVGAGGAIHSINLSALSQASPANPPLANGEQ